MPLRYLCFQRCRVYILSCTEGTGYSRRWHDDITQWEDPIAPEFLSEPRRSRLEVYRQSGKRCHRASGVSCGKQIEKEAFIIFLITHSMQGVKIMVEKFPNFQQNVFAFVRGWQLVVIGATWPFWIMWHKLEVDSWDVQAGVPVQFSLPLMVDSDGLLDSSPGHMVFLVQYLGLFQAALVARIV